MILFQFLIPVESCGISFSNPSSNASASSSIVDYPSFHVHFQQSLLISIYFHFQSQHLKSSLEWNRDLPRSAIYLLMKGLPAFFQKAGYVKAHFFESQNFKF
ncbi:hypothetical protein GEMRC1_005050 [Eukaryota sp. GEM-RC1]